MPEVLNKSTDGIPNDAIYVGRPTKYGNPYQIGRDGSRRTVVILYALYITNHPELMEAARNELAGKDLVCWCAPQLCHADVLLEVANDASSETT